MTQTPYSYKNKHHSRYTFISTGKANIIKVVDFSQTNIEGVYNLAFGNLSANNTLDDKANSNNGDILKVLVTVVQIIRDFTSRQPDARIFFTGSTIERKRLYSRILKTYHQEFFKEFIINGLILSEEVYHEYIFDPEDAFDYSAFIVERIN